MNAEVFPDTSSSEDDMRETMEVMAVCSWDDEFFEERRKRRRLADCAAHDLGEAPDRRAARKERQRIVWEEHFALMVADGGFRATYRMTPAAFQRLHGILRADLERDKHMGALRGGAVRTESQLAMGLRFLAGGSFHDLKCTHGVSKATFFECSWRVFHAINRNKSAVGPLQFPSTREECHALAHEFEGRSASRGVFSHVVGCVDGIFVTTKAPSANDTNNVIRHYSGHKRAYGLNMQVIADANYRILAMSCKWPGETNDITAWRRSKFHQMTLGLPRPYMLLGDNAYPLSDQLLTPYAGVSRQDRTKDTFNFYLSQLRIKVEQTFGILVARWGILWRPLRVAYHRQGALLQALCHLHNFYVGQNVAPIQTDEESPTARRRRPDISEDRCLPPLFATQPSGRPTTCDCNERIRMRECLNELGLERTVDNLARNAQA